MFLDTSRAKWKRSKNYSLPDRLRATAESSAHAEGSRCNVEGISAQFFGWVTRLRGEIKHCILLSYVLHSLSLSYKTTWLRAIAALISFFKMARAFCLVLILSVWNNLREIIIPHKGITFTEVLIKNCEFLVLVRGGKMIKWLVFNSNWQIKQNSFLSLLSFQNKI